MSLLLRVLKCAAKMVGCLSSMALKNGVCSRRREHVEKEKVKLQQKAIQKRDPARNEYLENWRDAIADQNFAYPNRTDRYRVGDVVGLWMRKAGSQMSLANCKATLEMKTRQERNALESNCREL